MVQRYRGIAVFLLWGVGIIHFAGAEDLAKDPDKRIFYTNPDRCMFYPQNHLFLAASYLGIYAFDTISGELRWFREAANNQRFGSILYPQAILLWSGNEIFLMNPITGKEIWAHTHQENRQLCYVHYLPDTDSVVALDEKGSTIYDIAHHGERAFSWPIGYVRNMFTCDKDTVCFRDLSWAPDGNSQETWGFLNLQTGVCSSGWRQPPTSDTRRFIPSPRSGGVIELTADPGKRQTLTFHDMHSGAVTRELADIPENSQDVQLLSDEKHLLYLSEDLRAAYLMNLETGAIGITLSQEGHYFDAYILSEDSSGTRWVFSRDVNNHRYAWPLAAGGTPQKVLDGRLVAPGAFQLNFKDSGNTVMAMRPCGLSYTIGAYSLDGAQRRSQWNISSRTWMYEDLINISLTHYVVAVPKPGPYSSSNCSFEVYIQDRAQPIQKGNGRPIAISPGARYLAAQTEPDTCTLYDIRTGEVLERINDHTQTRITAAFSAEDRYAVVNTGDSLTMIHLTGDYEKKKIKNADNINFRGGEPCFAPKGSLFLIGGYGSASLCDAATGLQVHCFSEPERFERPYRRREEGFFSGLAEAAREFVSSFTTDEKPYVTACFMNGGEQAVTDSVGQVIRVWDTDSGSLIRTIRTELPQKRNTTGNIRNRIQFSPNKYFAVAYNSDNFGTASLWSLESGRLLRLYQFPGNISSAVPSDDGTAVFVVNNRNLYQWPGVSLP